MHVGAVYGIPVSFENLTLFFRYADVNVGNTCEVENTPYIAYGVQDEFINIVSRYARTPSDIPVASS